MKHATKFNVRSFATLVSLFLLCIPCGIKAQRISLKSNALYLLTGTLNVGAEFRVSRHFTMAIDFYGNPVKVGKDWKTHVWGGDAEVRYWFARPLARHFVGVIGAAETHNVKIGDKCHLGDGFAMGLTYGYAMPLSSRWNVEASVGAGLAKVRDYGWSGPKRPNSFTTNKIMPVPMKASLSLVYILK